MAMRFSGRRVLVTGAAGFIGSHLAEALVHEGARVTALVRYNSRSDCGCLDYLRPDIRDAIEMLFGDIRDPDQMRRAVEGQEFVFHLAALVGIPYSYHAPHSYVETNVVGTLNILQAALQANVQRVVLTSTSEVYGTSEYSPIDEKHPLKGQSPYSASKIGADMLSESFWRTYGLQTSVIRPFNTFGPRQSARAVIPTVLSQLASGQPVLRVGSVEPVRDFTFVLDVTDGFLSIAMSEDTVGTVTNVGSGEGIAVGELVRICCEVAGQEAEVETAEERVRPKESEVWALVCDASRAQSTLGWVPRHSLREGLTETWEFVRKHPALFSPQRYAI